MAKSRYNRKLKSFLSWRALWHLQFIPGACVLFRRPMVLLANYVGVRSDTRDYRTRAGQCFKRVTPDEAEALFVVFLKREYGDVEVPGDVIDVGSHMGAFSLFAACRPRTKRVLAFEPMPSTFQRLRENVAASAGSQRVTCVHSAVEAKSGFVQMVAGATSQENRTTEATDCLTESATSIPAITLASIFDSYHVETCALLKIDCEGAEYRIIENLPPKYFQRIYSIRMEVHYRADGRSKEEFFRFIEEQGFSVERPLDHGVIWFRRKNWAGITTAGVEQ
jgi:FkbM family methyltransferase